MTACLCAVGLEEESNFGKYHRVLSRASWSSKVAAKILLGLLIKAFDPSNGPLLIGVDETLERWSGKKIKAKGPYRDTVRSKGKQVVICLGLQWLCFMLIVPLPWNTRY